MRYTAGASTITKYNKILKNVPFKYKIINKINLLFLFLYCFGNVKLLLVFHSLGFYIHREKYKIDKQTKSDQFGHS